VCKGKNLYDTVAQGNYWQLSLRSSAYLCFSSNPPLQHSIYPPKKKEEKYHSIL